MSGWPGTQLPTEPIRTRNFNGFSIIMNEGGLGFCQMPGCTTAVVGRGGLCEKHDTAAATTRSAHSSAATTHGLSRHRSGGGGEGEGDGDAGASSIDLDAGLGIGIGVADDIIMSASSIINSLSATLPNLDQLLQPSVSISAIQPRQPRTTVLCNPEAGEGVKKEYTAGTTVVQAPGARGTCQFEGCAKTARLGHRHCIKHGGGKKRPCSVDGCSTTSARKGLCTKHGGGYGECTIKGCSSKMVSKLKTCYKHGGYGYCAHASGCSTPAIKAKGNCAKHTKK